MNGYKKLENQPLKLVLAEFRFSSVLEIAKFIPKIQEELRRDYPTSGQSNNQTIQVQPGSIGVATMDKWAFISANGQSAIDINQERLVYMTAEYPRFARFSDACKQAIEVLADIVEPSLVLRIGLRYSDLVLVDAGEEVSKLVDKHFGYPECLGSLGATQHARTETFLRTDIGELVVRTMYGQHNLTCLPDMQVLPVFTGHDTVPSERIILDFDHFWAASDEPVSFEVNDALKKLDRLHESSIEAFWKVTKDYARNEKWA